MPFCTAVAGSSVLVWLFLFLLMTSDDGTHSSFRNVVGKFTSHTVHKPRSQKTVFYSRWKSTIRTLFIFLHSVALRHFNQRRNVVTSTLAVLRRFGILVERILKLTPSVRSSVRTHITNRWTYFIIFDTGVSHRNLSCHLNFNLNRIILSNFQSPVS
jgi:hypothetical protein